MATDREIQELARVARDLVTRIDALVGGTGEQMVELSKTARTNRRMIVILWAGFVLDIALTVAVAIGGFALADVSKRVENTQELQTEQVLCPLYRLLLESDTPAARQRAIAGGQDMTVRDKAFREIRQSYKVLNCKGSNPQ